MPMIRNMSRRSLAAFETPSSVADQRLRQINFLDWPCLHSVHAQCRVVPVRPCTKLSRLLQPTRIPLRDGTKLDSRDRLACGEYLSLRMPCCPCRFLYKLVETESRNMRPHLAPNGRLYAQQQVEIMRVFGAMVHNKDCQINRPNSQQRIVHFQRLHNCVQCRFSRHFFLDLFNMFFFTARFKNFLSGL